MKDTRETGLGRAGRKVACTALAAALAAACVPVAAVADPADAGDAAQQESQDAPDGGSAAELVDISGATAQVVGQTFTGSALEPVPTVVLDGVQLTAGTDFEVASYADNVHAGTATVTVAGIGSYTGTLDVAFAISPKDISSAGFDVSDLERDTAYTGYVGGGIDSYTGKSGDAVLELGTDFDIRYDDDATDVGGHPARVVGIGDYTGEIPFTLHIVAADVSACDVAAIPAQAWTGQAVEPAVSLSINGHELAQGTDYSVSYRDNVAGGTAIAVVTGTGNLEGTLEVPFEISKAAGSLAVDASGLSTLCPGGTAELAVTAPDGAAVSAVSSDASVAAVAVEGSKVVVTAKKAGTASVAVSASASSGHSACGPVYVAVSVRDHAYSAWSLAEAPSAGQPGSAVRTCSRCGSAETEEVSVKAASVTVEAGPFAVTGSPVEPAVEVEATDTMGNSYTLVPGTDYTVSYRDNVAAGVATAVVESAWPHVACELPFRIGTASIATTEVDGLGAVYDYTGRSISRKGVSLTLDGIVLAEGTDYKVSQSSTCAGVRKLTFTGTGSYTGTLKRAFLIDPPKPGKVKVTRLDGAKLYVKWKNAKCRSAKVTGYRVTVAKKSGKVIKRVRVSGRNKSSATVKLASKYAKAKGLRVSVASYKDSKGARYVSGESR